MNEARKANKRETQNEKKRLSEDPQTAARRQRQEEEDKKKEALKERAAQGEDTELSELLQATAEHAQKEDSKRRKKTGINEFDPRTQDHFSFEKRSARVPTYNREQIVANTGLIDLNSISYGKSAAIPEENIDNMVNELDIVMKKRLEKRKRNQTWQDADITFINDKNRLFNQRVDKFFGKYTADIKASLERGTAL
eukprot:TRINITY_DN9850_c0_g1_i1.p1 TRINITY_DN9850_c0_g1~~TRINITY_DN9850_c0_g1_i1.p1  ORF type:complete len:196 (-),score=44.41 TRINITY_DN9850_c0_g1_i1:91-678(-)